MASAIERLRRVADALRTGVRPLSDDAEWLASAVARYERAAMSRQALGQDRAEVPSPTIDDFLGLAPAPGEWPWWRAEALRRRDDALRAAAPCFHGRSTRGRARAMLSELANYAAIGWRIERRRPEAYGDDLPAPRKFFFAALKTGEPLPGLRQLITIISEGCVCNEMSLLIAHEPADDATNQANKSEGSR